MNKSTSCLYLMTTLLLASGLCMAQNPFRSLGVKESEAPVLTLSNGRYPEVIENDTLIRIGSVLLHGPSGTIAGFIQTDTLYSESRMEPEIISKWLSPDPVIKPFESPYAGMGNNPILYMDPDGGHNVVYLVVAKNKEGKAHISKEKAVAIAKKTNEYFTKLGLDTRVILFDESKYGQFDVAYLDKTDGVAVLGKGNRKDVVDFTRNNISNARADALENWESKEIDNPENSANGRTAEGNKLGIAIDTDDKWHRWFKDELNVGEIEAAAISIVHGAGHNADDKDPRGQNHYGTGIMMEGNNMQKLANNWYIHQDRVGIDVSLLDKNNYHNKIYKEKMERRFGSWQHSDNYNENKNTNKRHYVKD